jgi:PhnB protein
MEVSTYLFFNGDCETAFNFYAQCLDGKMESMMKHEGSPAAKDVPPEWLGKILHARMKVGSQVLMGSDTPPEHYSRPEGFSVSLGIEAVADAERIFEALAENGKVSMPLQKTFWAARFGMVVDRFGTPWMINCEGAS